MLLYFVAYAALFVGLGLVLAGCIRSDGPAEEPQHRS